ncbi:MULTISPECIES: hypothetical protein [Cyanophyceae]|uniref:hypothetical protein n=1 Tax=Cyanophyceae TaxID=3028117 RepID=UPI001687B039|nr:hypothetical protein [Trichocoleus sp. FACHB-40]MBD2006502.1 hypothetical protein [Trichocoleus sp. FACHB-40]
MKELSISQIQEIYGIKQAAAYKWRKFLYEKGLPSTEENLNALRDYIATHGTYKGFMEGGELATVKTAEIAAETPQLIYENEPGIDPVMALVRAAQSRATGELIAEKMLAAEFRANPDKLDEDLRNRIREVEERTAPKSCDPMQYAQELIRQRNQHQAAA